MVLRAEQVCGYDLDDVDQQWLTNLNGERAVMGQTSITGNLNYFCYRIDSLAVTKTDNLPTSQLFETLYQHMYLLFTHTYTMITTYSY